MSNMIGYPFGIHLVGNELKQKSAQIFWTLLLMQVGGYYG